MDERPRHFWSRRRVTLGAGLLALGAAGVAAAPSGLLAHARHGFGHFRHHRAPHAFGEQDVAFAVAWLLRDVDASEAQVAAVTEIAQRAAADLAKLRDAHRARHDAFSEALVAADRGALETLRSEELARRAGGSQRLVSALADAAEVLTPEQRRRLAEAHAEHQGGGD